MAETRRSGHQADRPALEAMYRFILWLVPTVEKFPRSQKFLSAIASSRPPLTSWNV